MADIVQLRIERTIPELEQMERVGLFTKVEISKIVKRRRTMEYKLRKHKKCKEDYLKYIQYEINLLSLIAKRRKKTGYFFKKQEIEHAIATRINKLFKIACSRFSNDVKLWLSQIEFCKRMHWNHTISGLFCYMLQMHNKKPALWVMAAKWEMEENNAPENARRILQRALRFHPESKLLWQEYFRMELMYTDLILKRKEVLKLNDMQDDSENNDAILEGKIAMLVYSKAVEENPDVEFSLSFLPICQDFTFTKSHEEKIHEDIQTRHPDKEETWDAIARYPLSRLQEKIDLGKKHGIKKKEIIKLLHENVISNFEDYVQKIPSEKMWDFYIRYVLSNIEKAKSEKSLQKAVSHALNILKRASALNCLSEKTCEEWIQLLYNCGKEDEAKVEAKKATHLWPEKVHVWILCLGLHTQGEVSFDTLSQLFNESLNHIPEKDTLPLWLLHLEWVEKNHPVQLKDLFEKGIHKCAEVSIPLKEKYLEFAVSHGIEEARQLYTRLINLRPVPLKLFEKMIDIEAAQKNPSIERLRRYFEDESLEFGESSAEMWINYIRMETSHPQGKPTAVGQIYWRAVKSLKKELVDSFINQYTLLAPTFAT